MITWVRIDRGIGDDPKIYQLAETLKLDQDAVIGKLIRVFSQMAEHAQDGDLSNVPDSALEDWARWYTKRGRFAAAFRELFAPQGVVIAWDKHNGASILKAERDAERKAAQRAEWAAQKDKKGARQSTPNTADKETNGAETARAGRAPVHGLSRVDVTRRNVTKSLLLDIGASGDAPAEVDDSPAGFVACWKSYPKRPNDSRKKALKAWQARIRAKVPDAVLLAGVERYAAFCDRTGKTGTQYAMQAATFFGPDEHYLADWTDGQPADPGAGLLAMPADALLAKLDIAGLSTFGGNRESYYRMVDKMADTLKQPHDKFRAFVKELKPWDLPGSFRPDRVRMLDGRLAAARQALA